MIFTRHRGKQLRETIEWVEIRTGVSEEELRSRSRKPHLVNARFLAFWILNKHFDWSLVAIGEQFKMDHTTVLNGVRRAEERNLFEMANPHIH